MGARGQLELRLLGGFDARVDGQSAPLPQSCRLLLAHLALARDRRRSRDHLFALLWPDSDEEHARGSLRYVLWRLRQVLGPAREKIITNSDDVRLDPAIWIDVHVFESRAAATHATELSTALDLYGGDLWADLIGDVAEAARERVRDVFMRNAERLVRLQLDNGDPTAALATARRMLDIDSYRESAQRLTLEALAALGDRGRLVEHYKGLARLFGDDLGLAPSAETRELYLRLLHADPPRVEWRDDLVAEPPADFVGRRREYEDLVAGLRDAIDGRGRVVVVSGEAGAGKTRLLRELGRNAADHGIRVLGAGSGMTQRLPYRLWVDALQSAAPEAAGLPPPWPSLLQPLFPELAALGLEPVSSELDRGRLFDAVVRLLRRLAAPAPVLVLLDDLHAADADSLSLLLHVARRVAQDRVALVCATRVGELSDEIVVAIRAADVREVELDPLNATEVAELLRGRGVDASTAPWLGPVMAAWTGGNPFFVEQGVRALADAGALRAAPNGLVWSGERPSAHARLVGRLPAAVRETVRYRLASLPPETRRVLGVAAVLDGEFRSSELAAISDRAEVEIVEDLAPALVAGMLREGRLPDSLVFAHELVREAIYQSHSRAMRAALHRRIAAALANRLAPAVLARHLMAAGELAQARGQLLVAAATAEASAASDEALAAYDRALELSADDRSGRVEILERIGMLELRRGFIGRGIARLEQALGAVSDRDADGAERGARLRVLIADACAKHNHPNPAAADYAEAAIRYYAREAPGTKLAGALLAKAGVLGQPLDLAAAEVAAVRALELGRQLSAARLEARAWRVLALVRWMRGDVTAGPDPDDLRRIGQELGDDEEMAYLLIVRSIRELRRGDREGARAATTAGLEMARRLGSRRAELWALEGLAFGHLYDGRWEQSVGESLAVQQLARDLDIGTHGQHAGALHIMGLGLAMMNREEEALACCRQLLALRIDSISMLQSGRHERPAHSTGLELAVDIQLRLSAHADADATWGRVARSRPACASCEHNWLAVVAESQVRRGHPRVALRLAAELESRSRVSGSSQHLVWASYLRAAAQAGMGDRGEALQEVRRAAEGFARLGWAYGLAVAGRLETGLTAN